MADKKITELNQITTIDPTDIFPVVDDPAGSPETKKSTFQQLADWLASLSQNLTNKTLQGNNNVVVVSQKDSTNTARDVAKIDNSDVLTIGNTTTTTKIKAGSNTTSGHTVPNVADDTFALLSNLNNSIYRQALINGNFDIWQRSTSAAGGTGSPYVTSADRWNNFRSGGVSGSTFSRQDGTGVTGSRYCMRVQRNSSNTSTAAIMLGQAIETANSIFLRGKKLTLSFWARKGVDYSASGSILQAGIGAVTAIDESFATNSTFIKSQNFTLTTSWQKFTLTTDNVIASDVNTVKVGFVFYPTGTAGANDYYEITQVQLCIDEIALPFQPKSFNEELRECQRYFYRINALENYYKYGEGVAGSSTQVSITFILPSALRTSPTVNYLNCIIDDPGVSLRTISSMSALGERNHLRLLITCASTTAYKVHNLLSNNTTNSYLEFSAEL